MRKGFTLLELLIVVIVVSILASFAVPQYLKAVERAKEGKGKHSLGLIAQAEKMYRAENDQYTAVADDNVDATLGSYVELKELDGDNDWDFSVAVSGTNNSEFTATSTRKAGPQEGNTITLDEDGTWGGDFSL